MGGIARRSNPHGTSIDGVSWSAEEAVTTEFLLDDWVPSLAEAPDGTLVVVFVSQKWTNVSAAIFVARKRVSSATWEAPVRLTVNSAVAHDQLPYVARTGNELTMVWVRHDTHDANFVINPKSEPFSATSTDGVTWSAPVQVTTHQGNVANLCPQLLQRHDGAWALLWLSTRNGSPRQYELLLSRFAQFPAGLVETRFCHRATRTEWSRPQRRANTWRPGCKARAERRMSTFGTSDAS